MLKLEYDYNDIWLAKCPNCNAMGNDGGEDCKYCLGTGEAQVIIVRPTGINRKCEVIK